MSRLSKPLKSRPLRVTCCHFHRLDRGSCLRRCWRRSCCAYGHIDVVCGPLDSVVVMFSASIDSSPLACVCNINSVTRVSIFTTATCASGHTHSTRHAYVYARAAAGTTAAYSNP